MVLVPHPPHSGGRASVPHLTNAGEQAMYGFLATLSLISLWPIRPWTAHSWSCGSTSLLLLVTTSVLTVKNNFIHLLVQGEEIFQTIPEWARFSRGDRRKMQKKLVTLTRKYSWKSCFTTHLPLRSSNPKILKSYYKKLSQNFSHLRGQERHMCLRYKSPALIVHIISLKN